MSLKYKRVLADHDKTYRNTFYHHLGHYASFMTKVLRHYLQYILPLRQQPLQREFNFTPLFHSCLKMWFELRAIFIYLKILYKVLFCWMDFHKYCQIFNWLTWYLTFCIFFWPLSGGRAQMWIFREVKMCILQSCPFSKVAFVGLKYRYIMTLSICHQSPSNNIMRKKTM